MKTMNIDYAEFLKQYREMMFLSQRDLAAKLGVSYTRSIFQYYWYNIVS